MERNKIKLGVFGFGCVGQGLYKVLEKNIGFKAEIVKICVKDSEKSRIIKDLENLNNGRIYQQPAKHLFTTNAEELFSNNEINVIVEVTNDAEAAFEIVRSSLQNGKAVVTANKKMIAEHFAEILELQKLYNLPVLYEAAACASIPVIRNFEEYYDNDLLNSFFGIMNGTTNYILSEIFTNNLSYNESLSQAQEKGYAESNPTMDVDGFDSKYKLSILLAHAFGIAVNPEDVINSGIRKINSFDVKFARERGCKIKLVARAHKLRNGAIAAFVLPELVKADHEFYNVDNVFNGIITESNFADRNIFIGKGAGEFPTASALLSDISALSYNYKYEYKKLQQYNGLHLDKNFLTDVYVRFKKPVAVEEDLFEEVYERYFSRDDNFITGRVNFGRLAASGLLEHSEVNIILLNDFISQQETKTQLFCGTNSEQVINN